MTAESTLECASQAYGTPTPSISDWRGTWIVGECRPQHVFTAQTRIRAAGVPCYVPCEELERCYGGKNRKVTRPLFHGYLFACLPAPELKLAVKYAFGVYATVDVVNQARLHEELAAVEVIERSRNAMCIYRGLIEGRRVEVNGGPMKGAKGLLEIRGKHHRFCVRMDVLGQSVAVEIDAALLDPLD
jgi:transcription antitermination factor NusG